MGAARPVEGDPNEGLRVVDHRIRVAHDAAESKVRVHIRFPVFVLRPSINLHPVTLAKGLLHRYPLLFPTLFGRPSPTAATNLGFSPAVIPRTWMRR